MLVYDFIKIAISALLIFAISSLAKKSSILGAILASIPLVSVLAILWMYWDHSSLTTIAALSRSIFWLVLPSLVFFWVFPILLDQQFSFYPALFFSLGMMIVCYFLMIYLLKLLHVNI